MVRCLFCGGNIIDEECLQCSRPVVSGATMEEKIKDNLTDFISMINSPTEREFKWRYRRFFNGSLG